MKQSIHIALWRMDIPCDPPDGSSFSKAETKIIHKPIVDDLSFQNLL